MEIDITNDLNFKWWIKDSEVRNHRNRMKRMKNCFGYRIYCFKGQSSVLVKTNRMFRFTQKERLKAFKGYFKNPEE